MFDEIHSECEINLEFNGSNELEEIWNINLAHELLRVSDHCYNRITI